MRKFKCVKNYPGADLGTIVQYQLGAFPEYFDIKDAKRYNKKDIENYPEFWEEIIEKDYEILMYRSKNNSCIYFDNPKYFSSLNSDWEIYSIRRKSDGVEFKIEDKVYWKWASAKNKYFTIKSFNIIEGTLKFNTVEESAQNFTFELVSKEYNLQHYKEPILTTEDGYECTLDDRVFGVLPKGSWETRFGINAESGILVHNLYDTGGKRYSENSPWLWFKTKENAEKYIYENKPEFSRKQILDVIDVCDSYYTTHDDNYFVKVSDLRRLLNL